MYANAQAQAEAGQQAGGEQAQGQGAADDVVDAEFTEVKDEDKK